MRNRILFPFLFLPLLAFAQKDDYLYYQQNAVIVAPAYDCYHKNLDAGLAAKRRGDCETALRYFHEALGCDEVQGNTRWTDDLGKLIESCNKPAALKAADKRLDSGTKRVLVQSIAQRRYTPSKAFLSYNGDSCFVITSREADMAFAGAFWDDAAKLYRAAKSCRDADQAERSLMNARIAACRDAAEDELRQKEQAAVRAARHAIANNTADDSEDNLLNYNRTLAYRLADFGNEYIAPEDNPRCIQALLDAWYYRPAIQSGTSNTQLQVPFCYQIAGNLPAQTEIRHAGRREKGTIYAYSSEQSLLWSWDAVTFEPKEPVRLSEKFRTFEASPDGETLVFIKDNGYLLWRNPRQSLKVTAEGSYLWSFSAAGDVFYYFNTSEQSIEALNIRDVFAVRKGRPGKVAPMRFFENVSPELVGFAVRKGICLLAYPNRIEIWKQENTKVQWVLEKTIVYAQAPQFTIKTTIYPEAGLAVVNSDTVWVYNLNAAFDTLTVMRPVSTKFGRMFASSDDGSLIATTVAGGLGTPDRMIVANAQDSVVRFGSFINALEWPDYPTATFSRDNHWLFSVSMEGTLFAWDLSTSQSDWLFGMDDVTPIALSPNGMNLIARKDRNLVIVNTDTRAQSAGILGSWNKEPTLLGVSDSWLACQYTADTLKVTSHQNRRHFSFPLAPLDGTGPMVAFSPDEKLIAYEENPKTVVLRSLESGAVVASKTFDGEISGLLVLPESDALLVVLGHGDPSTQNVRTVAKIWYFTQQNAKFRPVRLHNYDIKMVNISPNGQRIALSDGRDIRIFNQDDLSDEVVRIHRRIHHDKKVGITAFAFHPNSLVMAVGYTDGSVDVWDAEDGTVLYQLQRTGDQGWVRSLAFTNEGRKIRQLNGDFTLAIRDLDPATIREQAQTTYRKLMPFTPEQIREYELEDAMNYPGNFERLAESGEWPLIRAFFEYYFQQSHRSNNIAQVKQYCERAFILYQQLDEETQKTLRGTMLEIYRDFHWKWILRGNQSNAALLVEHMNRNFDNPAVALEADAYTKLLAGDLRASARSFTEWLTRAYRIHLAEGSQEWSAMDTLENKIRQMAEYDLLEDKQRACVCGMLHEIADLKSICPEGGKTSDVPFDNETKALWNILVNRVKAGRSYNLGYRDRLLRKSLDEARALYRQNPEKIRPILQELIFQTADNEYQRGLREQYYKQAPAFFQRSNALLLDTKFNPIAANDSAKLYALSRNYLELSRAHLKQDNAAEAKRDLDAGLRSAEALYKMSGDSLSETGGPAQDVLAYIWEQVGFSRLFTGNAAGAKDAFQRVDYLQQYLYYASSVAARAVNNGHASLLAGDETDALIQYGSIEDEKQLGETLTLIERMAEKNPEQRARLNAFMPRLKNAFLATNSLDTNRIEYFFCRFKYETFAAQSKWDSALYWSNRAMRCARNGMNLNTDLYWTKDAWLDEHLSQAYYLLISRGKNPAVLDQVISISEEALNYATNTYTGYQHLELIKTNLGHAYWLRNRPGDREKGLQYYREFLKSTPDYGRDNMETLERDFRSLSDAGIVFPDFQALLDAIGPAADE